jgi:peptidoglycan/LPS O-acetylase OafA/YrhL
MSGTMDTGKDQPSGDATAAAAADAAARQTLRHIPLLDGWRALSITLVLVGHLLPVGPKSWALNDPTAAMGMVMFFTLSGFLITRFLVEDGNLRRFLIRRLLRIIPLGWLGMLLAALLDRNATSAEFAANLFFYANLPPFYLFDMGGHFWSLCLEIQFYASIALLVALGGKRALLLIPLACLCITVLRVAYDEPLSIVSWFRGDEILAGATLALIYEGWLGERARRIVAWPRFPVMLLLLVLLFASADARSAPLAYARPYISALLIGSSIYNAPQWLRQLSAWWPVVYIAKISFALYVFHGIFMISWLGTGPTTLIKYAKRPLLLAMTFGCAHLSTFHYERRWIDLARRLTRRQAAP